MSESDGGGCAGERLGEMDAMAMRDIDVRCFGREVRMRNGIDTCSWCGLAWGLLLWTRRK